MLCVCCWCWCCCRAFWLRDGPAYFISPAASLRFQFMSLHQLGAPGCLVAHGFNSGGWRKVRRDRNKRIKALLQQQQQQHPNMNGKATANGTAGKRKRTSSSPPKREQQEEQQGSSSSNSSSSTRNGGPCLRILEEGPVQAWEVVDECCFVLQQMFAQAAQPEPLQAFVTRWDEDPLFKCAYGYPSKVCCCFCCCYCVCCCW